MRLMSLGLVAGLGLAGATGLTSAAVAGGLPVPAAPLAEVAGGGTYQQVNWNRRYYLNNWSFDRRHHRRHHHRNRW